MDVSEEFRKHAAECKRMARTTREREEKKVWSQMAERWLVCADNADRMTPPPAWRGD
jgi:hypothetical protein